MDIYRTPQYRITATVQANSNSDAPVAQPIGQQALPLPAAITDDALNMSANRAIQRRHYGWALRMLDQLVGRHPNQASYYSNRGLVHLWCGHLQAALEDCSHAILLDPALAQAYNNRASCYVALGFKAKAIADYDQAIDLNPFNIKARINLAITLRDLGDWDEALAQLDEALMFHQLPDFVYAERGRTHHLRGDWNCAIADYQRALTGASLERPTSQRQHMIDRVKGWMSDLLEVAA
jgi:tetratricopeptide (TPR) repeat protein